jgi:hypothetical protein
MTADDIIIELAKMARIAQVADPLLTGESRPLSYHEIADSLSHTAWQLDSYVDNDEGLNRDRDRVLDEINGCLDIDGTGTLDHYDRSRFENRLLPIYTRSASDHVVREYMSRKDAYGAIPEAIAFTIDAAEALWRESR